MKYFPLIYFLVFFSLGMLLPSYRIWRTSGVNPYKLGVSESAHDYIGRLFRLVMAFNAVVTFLFAFFPGLYQYLLSILQVESPLVKYSGIFLLILALAWVLLAQMHMNKSWRIGIDQDVHTDLVQTGLFKLSRNPIFLGMRIMLLGIFLYIPSVATLVVLTSGELLIQIQVRLEEEFLARVHGASYQAYQKQVRRWI